MVRVVKYLLLLCLAASRLDASEPPWISPARFRLVLRVDPLRGSRSRSPAALSIDPAGALAKANVAGRFDEHTIEVVAHDDLGVAAVFDTSRPGYERHLLPWRLEPLYGSDDLTLHFVLPDESATTVAVYFDTIDSKLGRPERYLGPVGDGDFLREGWSRREIGATHFDCFADLDRDGDLDLFSGGVEPYIHVHENVGGNRLVPRGRLTSAGAPLKLPCNAVNRSWVVPHFHDLDDDGDLDFVPSFMSGPHARKLVLFENTTPDGGPLTFVVRGALETAKGTPIASGDQAGGWFPSVAFVRDRGALDLIVGSNNHCYLYQSLGRDADGRWRWAEAVAIDAGGEEIELFNPCFATADVDADGDFDLFAAPQSGQIGFYENLGSRDGSKSGADGSDTPRGVPEFAAGRTVAYDEHYLQRSTHPRVTIADFTGDGLLDFVVDRAWELSDLRRDSATARDFGALFANVGSTTEPRWERRDARHGAPYTEEHQKCDAVRQNVVRAVDWNRDGRVDVLAGDCDGFIWYYRNAGTARVPVFTPARKLTAGGALLSLAHRSGHARPDVVDWNNDGRVDLVVSDGAGGIWVYLDTAREGEPRLGAASRLTALDQDGVEKPIQRGTRSHVMVCDWNGDGRKDLVFSDQDNPGFWVFRNVGEDATPRFDRARRIPINRYVRPNLGSFVDWDGDGRKDLVACEFEHSIRLYRNVGSAEPGAGPSFENRDGEILVKPESIMMISGADVVDFNGDGDFDILTGQGHGGSGIRFYERDFVEDTNHDTMPVVTVERFESAKPVLLDVVRRYADAMLEHGRDTYGKVKSGLFLSALDRRRLTLLKTRPAPPGGIRRGDRAGLPWSKLVGANPHNDENFLRALYTLSELTGDPRYAKAADHEIRWFFENTQSSVTGLLPWGEHMSWDVTLDRPISSGTELTHEFARPWVLWERTWELAPDAARRFAMGLWEHQVANHRTGAYDRHALYDRHAPRDGKDFPRHGGFYVHTWAHAYAHSRDEIFLRAIRSIVERFERKRNASAGGLVSTMGPLDVAAAATLVPDKLARYLRRFAAEEDRLILAELAARYRQPDGSWRFPVRWEAGYSSGTSVDWGLLALARRERDGGPSRVPTRKEREPFRELVVAVADSHVDATPDEDVDVWPMTFAHMISVHVAAYRFTGRLVYLGEARRLAETAVTLYFQDSPLPRASLKTDHYETITGADSLALALLEVHVARSGLETRVPTNTIDR